MAGLLHGGGRTMRRVRAELQAAQASSHALAAQYGPDPKTVLKWRKRDGTADAPMGTNGQAERMNRTIKDATTKAFHYEAAEALRAHVLAFVSAYNFAKHLKALRWRTPFQATCDAGKANPSVFKINPHQLIPGPHT